MSGGALNIALVQMTSIDSLATNLGKFESIFKSLEPEAADLICFPENCLFLRIRENDPVEKFDLSHSCFLWLGEWARRLRSTIHLGSVPLFIDGRLYNSSVWIAQDGTPQAGYQKMHLFDIELEGQRPMRESAVFTRGGIGKTCDFQGWKIGESICYDIRFSELYSSYAYAGVELILVPAAFLTETGRAHWEVLLRARAIESQCYVVASAQVGVHLSTKGGEERKTYGHSMVIDPWGTIELNLGDTTEGVQTHRLDKEKIRRVRAQIPMASHRHGRMG